MDIITGLATIFGGMLVQFLVGWLTTVAGLLGVAACFWAIRLVMVQPRAAADEVGMSDQVGALLIAAPVFVAGFSAIVFAFGAT